MAVDTALPTSPALDAPHDRAASSSRTGTTILNIGCGTKTCSDKRVVNLDWSTYLFIKAHPLLNRLSRFVLSEERLARLRALPDSIVVHDLRKGIPYPDSSVDAVYHSHFLEHLDPPIARQFVQEVRRVLKPGGIQRIVVPDFERLAAEYLEHLHRCRVDPAGAAEHDRYVGAMIEQMVRREAYATRQQAGARRWLERLVVGDARSRGETHQWMYDRINLPHMLRSAGYSEVRVEGYDTSRIDDWNALGLDRNETGREYKPESLYVEAVK
ncbi:MAG: methyltransferase domain-containing protein [Vicinamibacterales bacterium]